MDSRSDTPSARVRAHKMCKALWILNKKKQSKQVNNSDMKQKIQERNDDATLFQIFHMYRGSSEDYTLNRMKYFN